MLYMSYYSTRNGKTNICPAKTKIVW